METQEIKIKGFRLFEATAIAMMNVSNGCFSDKKIVDENLPKLFEMVELLEENEMMQDFKAFVFSGKFNRGSLHFYTSKLFETITTK